MVKVLFGLILGAFVVFVGCGDDDDGGGKKPPNNALEEEFQAQIKPILDRSCAGSSCHTSGAGRDNIIKSGANLVGSRSSQLVASNKMPKPGSNQAGQFSAADKTAVLNFINKYK